MTEHQTCWETTLWNVSRQFDQCACLIVDKERRILTNWFNSPSDAGAWCLTDLCQVMEHVDGFLRQRQVGPALSLVLTQISKPSLLLLLGEQNLDDLVKSGQWQGRWLVRLCMFLTKPRDSAFQFRSSMCVPCEIWKFDGNGAVLR